MFLTEISANEPITRKQLDIINKDCSDVLKYIRATNCFLYRGAPSNGKFAGASLKKGRKPTETSNKIHDMATRYMKELGFIARRDNSIFCTSRFNTAKAYSTFERKPKVSGAVFLIFPKNGFDYTWSPVVSDFFLSYRSDDKIWNSYSLKNQREFEFQQKFKYQSNDFEGALQSGNEIMIHGEYYRILDSDTTRQIIKGELTI